MNPESGKLISPGISKDSLRCSNILRPEDPWGQLEAAWGVELAVATEDQADRRPRNKRKWRIEGQKEVLFLRGLESRHLRNGANHPPHGAIG